MGLLGFVGQFLLNYGPELVEEANIQPTYSKGRYSRQAPPKASGTYRWINIATGVIDYIGETNNLARRTSEHERSDSSISSKTHRLEWKGANPNSTSKERRTHESRKISQHNPSLNKRRGGGGRNAAN